MEISSLSPNCSPLTRTEGTATSGNFQDLLSELTSRISTNSTLSATDKTTSPPVAQEALSRAAEITTQFRSWKTEYFKTGISEDRRQEVEKYSAGFEQIVNKAVANNGYGNPQAFVQSLSASELETLQHIHCLADPIIPQGLSKEGALNLLLSPDKKQDIDNDGFQMCGLAKCWQFPPVNAPEYIKKAWKETTANMSGGDTLLLMGSFMPPPAVDGTPGNAFISPDASYVDLIKERLDGARFSSKFDEPWQREYRKKEIQALELFLGNVLAQLA